MTERHTIINVLLICICLSSILAIAGINRGVMGLLTLVFLCALILAVRGVLFPAKLIAPLAGMGFLFWLVFTYYGICDTAILGIPAIIIAASLVNGRWGALLFGMICFILVVILGVADLYGWKTFDQFHANAVYDCIAVWVAVMATTWLQWVVIGRLADTVSLARRELAERRLAQSHLQLALTAARPGKWEQDLRTDTITFSELFVSIFGEGDSNVPFERNHPDDLSAFRSVVYAVGSGEKENFAIEHRIIS